MTWGWIKKAFDKVKKFGKKVWGKVVKPVLKFVSPLAKAAGTAPAGLLGDLQGQLPVLQSAALLVP
jgi:hypothetical protein